MATPDDAREALRILGADGVPTSAIEVRSSVPLAHDLHAIGDKITSKVHWMAVLGAFLGGSALFSLVKFTSEAYPLPTGGMPIVSLPPAGVITFEGVAIGAILCTVGTVLYECGLPRLKGLGPLDQHLAEDHVLVAVECEDGAPEAWTANALETERV